MSGIAPNRADEEADLELAKRLVFRDSGLILQRFSRAETLSGRTPDFRVLRDSELVAFCEVKSPRDDWLEEQIDQVPAGEIAGGLRDDPTFNRIARHIEKAATQFDAVNANRAFPNVLIVVNHAAATSFADMRETVTGMFHGADGKRYPTVIHISEGRIADARFKIDLFVWIDGKSRSLQGRLFNYRSPNHIRTLRALLGLMLPPSDADR
jgi:hypothetical protein